MSPASLAPISKSFFLLQFTGWLLVLALGSSAGLSSVLGEDVRADASGQAADLVVADDLPFIAFSGSEEDHHRMHEALHGAHLLAEVGAGYEAARVLAAIAEQARDSEPGHEAKRILNEWGLSIDAVRFAGASEIRASITKATRERRRLSASSIHVRNLIELGLYREAALALRRHSTNATETEIERALGEMIHRYHLSMDLLRDDASESIEELVIALKSGHENSQLKRQIRFMRAIDPEASELAERLLRRIDPREHGDEEEEHFAPFEQWVERHDEDPDDDERRPSTEELVEWVCERAKRIASQSKPASRSLAMLVARAAPDSTPADQARALIERLESPNTNTFRRTVADSDPGAEVFGVPRVRDYRLELSKAAIDRLREAPKHYVRATFREGNRVYKDVGVRLKGSWGSFRMLDGQSKSAFTIKFNQFVKGQRFHGLRRIILNNAVQDPSYIRESIGYSLFRVAGVPAPRVGWATLSVNDEPYQPVKKGDILTGSISASCGKAIRLL